MKVGWGFSTHSHSGGNGTALKIPLQNANLKAKETLQKPTPPPQKVAMIKTWDSGHYFKAELFYGTIFDETLHKQCRKCNRFFKR
jgi:hypothetical protein